MSFREIKEKATNSKNDLKGKIFNYGKQKVKVVGIGNQSIKIIDAENKRENESVLEYRKRLHEKFDGRKPVNGEKYISWRQLENSYNNLKEENAPYDYSIINFIINFVREEK